MLRWEGKEMPSLACSRWSHTGVLAAAAAAAVSNVWQHGIAFRPLPSGCDGSTGTWGTAEEEDESGEGKWGPTLRNKFGKRWGRFAHIDLPSL